MRLTLYESCGLNTFMCIVRFCLENVASIGNFVVRKLIHIKCASSMHVSLDFRPLELKPKSLASQDTSA